MSDAVREIFIAGSKSGLFDYFARRRVDVFTSDARPGGVERGRLRALYGVPYALVLVGGFAENGRARDVGLIAFDAAPAVDQNDVAFAKLLRSHRAVRQRRILRKQDERKTMCRAKLAVSLSYLCG